MGGAVDLAITGAGIMGLACALESAKRGRSVAVFDPEGESHKASWAAAGILATRDARVFQSPFREFYVRSIREYPGWVEEISRLSGMPVPLRRGGDYLVYRMDTSTGRELLESRRRRLDREHARNYQV